MTAFPCYDNVADTLWRFATGEESARDRKVFLKGNKLMCLSKRYNALFTADFDEYWASAIDTHGKTLEFTPATSRKGVERIFILKDEALERDMKNIESIVPGVSWIKTATMDEGFNTSSQSEFRKKYAKETFEGKITMERLYFTQRLRRQVTDIFKTPLYYWVHSDSFDIYYFRRDVKERLEDDVT